MQLERDRLKDTAAAVEALKALECLLESATAETAESSLNNIINADTADNPSMDLLQYVASEVMKQPRRMTPMEVLEGVAEALKLDYSADL